MTVTHRNKRQQPEEITSTSLRFRMVSFPILHPLALSAHCWGSHALDTLRNRVLSLNLLTISGWVCRRHLAVNEPGFQIECDGCHTDLTHSIRIKCADPVCEPGDGVDICPACFCAGLEFAKHKRNHAYRVVVSFPDLIFFFLYAVVYSIDGFLASCVIRNYIHIRYSQRTGEQTSEWYFQV